jgi:hypothetical protein
MTDTTDIAKAEFKEAHSGPAVYSNRFYVTMTAHGVRIGFMEQSEPGAVPVFRNAVILSLEDGIALYKLLQGTLKDAESIIRNAQPQPQE